LPICILGDDPFGTEIDRIVEGEIIDGRKIVVERLRRGPVPKSCKVLFVSRSEKDVPTVLAGLSPGVLTVSDREAFLTEGGMIDFLVEDRRVRFDISLRNAAKGSMMMSARLLNVARYVQR
jgi:YfiR/HmsC-like